MGAIKGTLNAIQMNLNGYRLLSKEKPKYEERICSFWCQNKITSITGWLYLNKYLLNIRFSIKYNMQCNASLNDNKQFTTPHYFKSPFLASF